MKEMDEHGGSVGDAHGGGEEGGGGDSAGRQSIITRQWERIDMEQRTEKCTRREKYRNMSKGGVLDSCYNSVAQLRGRNLSFGRCSSSILSLNHDSPVWKVTFCQG
jgi:hypothetical protein